MGGEKRRRKRRKHLISRNRERGKWRDRGIDFHLGHKKDPDRAFKRILVRGSLRGRDQSQRFRVDWREASKQRERERERERSSPAASGLLILWNLRFCGWAEQSCYPQGLPQGFISFLSWGWPCPPGDTFRTSGAANSSSKPSGCLMESRTQEGKSAQIPASPASFSLPFQPPLCIFIHPSISHAPLIHQIKFPLHHSHILSLYEFLPVCLPKTARHQIQPASRTSLGTLFVTSRLILRFPR